MSDRLPPLTALRAFEAAARHMSFAKAADELNVTPAALSYQIKSLEADLGTPAFIRLNRAVELTEAGRALTPGVRDGFAAITSAWRNTCRLSDNTTLTVTAGPAFTSKWLAPRLFDFAQAHPTIELRFSASLRLVDFDRDEVDVAIRFGLGGYSGVYSEPLVSEWVTPMMTPEMAASFGTKETITKAPLIHDDSMDAFKIACDWAKWARAAKVIIDPDHGARFSQADHALDAAIAGAGVVLGRVSLAARALTSGRLVAPFDLGLITPAQFQFVCPQGNETRPKVKALHDWLLDEINTSKSFAEGRTLLHAADVE